MVLYLDAAAWYIAFSDICWKASYWPKDYEPHTIFIEMPSCFILVVRRRAICYGSLSIYFRHYSTWFIERASFLHIVLEKHILFHTMHCHQVSPRVKLHAWSNAFNEIYLTRSLEGTTWLNFMMNAFVSHYRVITVNASTSHHHSRAIHDEWMACLVIIFPGINTYSFKFATEVFAEKGRIFLHISHIMPAPIGFRRRIGTVFFVSCLLVFDARYGALHLSSMPRLPYL